MENKKRGMLLFLMSIIFIFGVTYVTTGSHTLGTVSGDSNITMNASIQPLSTDVNYVPEKHITNFTFYINNSGPDEIVNISITLPSGFYLPNNDTALNYSSMPVENEAAGLLSRNFTFYYQGLAGGEIVWAIGN